MIRHSTLTLLATALLVLLLLWAPLPWGGIASWAEASLEGLSFLALALAVLAVERPGELRPPAPTAAALAAIALLGAAQALPWPPALVAWLSPGHAGLYRRAAALLAPTAVPVRLTVAAVATRAAALTWAAIAACLLAGAVVGRRRARRRVLAVAILAAALFQLFFGARAALSGERTLWGVAVPISAERLRGTFFNPNHLAVYLEMALAIAFAWGWWTVRRARGEAVIERRVLLVAPPVLLWLLLFGGIVFTASRGGLVAAGAGAVVQGVLLAIVHRRWSLVSLGALAAVLGAAVAFAVGVEAGLWRLVLTLPFDVSWGARRQAWDATLELWRRFPLLGTGLGTFRDAFPLVQPRDLDGTWWHAHSGPLELLATTGLLGTALAAAGSVALALRLGMVLARGRRSEDRAAGLAALGALAAVALHEAFDFGLTLPANALTLAVLAGAACSARLARGAPAP
jgi:O-antigen ligase